MSDRRTFVFASGSPMSCHLQLAAALRRRGHRVERVVHGPHRRFPKPERMIERLVFHRVIPGLGPFADVDAPEVATLASYLGDRLIDLQAEDQIAAAFTKAASRERFFPRRTRDDFDENTLYDKNVMTAHAAALGWRVPATWAMDDDPAAPLPWVVKRRLGIGGVGLRIVNSPEEWELTKASIGPDAAGYLVQELIQGQIVKIVAVAREGALIQTATFRSQMHEDDPFGPSARIETIDDDEFVDATRTLLNFLGYTGMCGIDCIRAKDHSLVFLELNSRAPGSWAAANRSGTDFVGAYLYAVGAGPAVKTARAAPRPMIEVGTLRVHALELGWRWSTAIALLRFHRVVARGIKSR